MNLTELAQEWALGSKYERSVMLSRHLLGDDLVCGIDGVFRIILRRANILRGMVLREMPDYTDPKYTHDLTHAALHVLNQQRGTLARITSPNAEHALALILHFSCGFLRGREPGGYEVVLASPEERALAAYLASRIGDHCLAVSEIQGICAAKLWLSDAAYPAYTETERALRYYAEYEINADAEGCYRRQSGSTILRDEGYLAREALEVLVALKPAGPGEMP